jgi:hypothetical protein
MLVIAFLSLKAQGIQTSNIEGNYDGECGKYIAYHNGIYYMTIGPYGTRKTGVAKLDVSNDFKGMYGYVQFSESQGRPYGFAINSNGEFIIIQADNNVLIFNSAGVKQLNWTFSGSANDYQWSPLAVDASDRIYIAGGSNGNIQIFNRTGSLMNTISVGNEAKSLTINPDDESIWVLSKGSAGRYILSHFEPYPDLSLVNSWSYDSPIQGLPGTGYPNGGDNYLEWGSIVANNQRIVITQWYYMRLQDKQLDHRLLILYPSGDQLRCKMTSTASRADRRICLPTGLCLNNDLLLFNDNMVANDSPTYDHLNLIFSDGYCSGNTIPQPPTNLSIMQIGNQFKLNWTASTTPNVTYNIYYKTNSGHYNYSAKLGTVGQNTTTFTDPNNRNDGNNYCYVVRAVLNGEESNNSSEACKKWEDKQLSLSVNPQNIILACSDQGLFEITLSDEKGNHLIGKQIVVQDDLQDKSTTTSPTDNQGKVTYSVSKNNKTEGNYKINFSIHIDGYKNDPSIDCNVEIKKDDQSCYDIEISTDKLVYNLNENINFIIEVKTKDNKPVPNVLVAIFDPSPNLNYCPAPSTGQDGKAIYQSNTSGLDGWVSYGFYCSIISKGINFDPMVFPIVIDNGKPQPQEVTNSINANPIGINKQLGQKTKPDALNDMIDVGLQAGVNTVTNPVVVTGALLCAGGIVGSFFTAGETAPVAAVACPFTAEAAQLSFALEASKAASNKLVDYIDAPQDQKTEMKKGVDLVYTGIDFVFLVSGHINSPKSGKSILSYKISNNKGNFANQYAKDFIDQLGNYYDVTNDISSLNFTSGKGQIVNINSSTSVVIISSSIKDNNFSSTDFDRYNYSTIAYSYNPNRPPKIILDEPQNNSLNQEISLTCRWISIQNVTKCHLQISEDSTIMKSFVMKNGDEILASNFLINDSNIVLNSKIITGLKQGQTKYYWRVRAFKNNLWGNWSSLNNFTTVQISDVKDNNLIDPSHITLMPNPINEKTEIIISLDKHSNISLSITNNLGIEVNRIIDDREFEPGEYKFENISNNLLPGVYFCTLIAGNYIETIKFVVIK